MEFVERVCQAFLEFQKITLITMSNNMKKVGIKRNEKHVPTYIKKYLKRF